MMKRLRVAAVALLFATSAMAQTGQGTSPLSIAKGGTSAATASAARSALGVAIGSAVQAWDADLDALAALGGTNTIYYRSGANTWSAVTVGGLLSFSGGTLNVGDAELAAIAGLTSAADKCFYFTGSGTASTFDCLSWARSFISAATVGAGRTALGVAIGSDVQAYDADLAALAGLTSANNKCFYWTGSGTAATFDCSSFGRSVTNVADAAALRTLAGSIIGTDVQAFDSDLSALAGNSTNGLWVRAAAGTGAARTITGTTNEICVTNGDGVSGNPTLGICSGFLSTAHTWSGQQTFSAPILTGIADVQGSPKFTGISSPSQITANQNDYNPGSVVCATAETLRLTSDASRDVTGLAGGASGCQIVIMNVGSNPIVLKDQAAGSTAGNRMALGGDATVASQASYALRYDGTSSRWRPLVSPGAGGGGGGGVTSVACAEGAQCSTITTTGTVKTTYARHFMMGGM